MILGILGFLIRWFSHKLQRGFAISKVEIPKSWFLILWFWESEIPGLIWFLNLSHVSLHFSYSGAAFLFVDDGEVLCRTNLKTAMREWIRGFWDPSPFAESGWASTRITPLAQRFTPFLFAEWTPLLFFLCFTVFFMGLKSLAHFFNCSSFFLFAFIL